MNRKKSGKHDAPKRKITKSKSPDSILRRNKLKLDTLLLVFLTFVCCFFYLGSIGIVDARYQERAYLQNEIATIQTENERLRLEIGYLDSLDLVEQKAIEEMSMVTPQKEQCILINMAYTAPEVSQESNYPSLADISGNNQEFPLLTSAQQSISDILLRWNF
ncbi:hypothetical protein JR334_04235 [Clostridia bacterium]|nr:hypothetical protein JR334_04235 [Clostridia bacterium]